MYGAKVDPVSYHSPDDHGSALDADEFAAVVQFAASEEVVSVSNLICSRTHGSTTNSA